MNRVKRISKRHDRVRDDINQLRERNRAATRLNKVKFGKQPPMPDEVLLDKTVKELRAIARERGIKGLSRAKKADLVAALS